MSILFMSVSSCNGSLYFQHQQGLEEKTLASSLGLDVDKYLAIVSLTGFHYFSLIFSHQQEWLYAPISLLCQQTSLRKAFIH